MEQEQRIEFRALQTQAWESLRGLPGEVKGFSELFRLVTRPSFSNPTAWTLLEAYGDVQARSLDAPEPAPEPVYSLARTCWRQDIDLEKLRSPVERLRHAGPLQPTMERKLWGIESKSAQRWIDELAAMSIPVLPPRGPVGCDGTSYEFAFGNSFLGGTLTWWEQPPSEWLPFTGLFQKLILEFETIRQNG